jgi:hypothetical protein
VLIVEGSNFEYDDEDEEDDEAMDDLTLQLK